MPSIYESKVSEAYELANVLILPETQPKKEASKQPRYPKFLKQIECQSLVLEKL